MRRREFIALLGVAATCRQALRAQQSAMPVIGFVSFASRESTLQASWYHAFHERFFDHGWVPGKTVTIEYRFADNDRSKLVKLAEELARLKLDAIVVPTHRGPLSTPKRMPQHDALFRGAQAVIERRLRAPARWIVWADRGTPVATARPSLSTRPSGSVLAHVKRA